MVKRVVMGKLPGDTFGLRCSLPGFDVLTDDPDDIQKFSFNSDWTDVLRAVQFGVADAPVVGHDFAVISGSFTTIPFPALGYIPFVEVRQVDTTSNITYSDRTVAMFAHHGTRYISTPRAYATQNSLNVQCSAAPAKVFYVVFAEPTGL